MEYSKHINIRITDDQLKTLMSAVIDEKTTLSNLVRNIIKGYNAENADTINKRVKNKSKQ